MVMGFTEEDDGETGVSSVYTLSKADSNKISDFSLVPEPPFSLEADPLSSVSIKLTWNVSQATSLSRSLKYFTVCFSSVQTSRNKNLVANCVRR